MGRLRLVAQLALALALAGCSAPAASSNTTPVTSDRYAAMAAELQAELDNQVKAGLFISLSAAIVMPDGWTWTGASGPAVVEPATPATADTSYGIASITKTFVATLVLELAEDGVLRLDDTIGRWLPQLAGDARFSTDRVTIRQLLSHTSGIADYEGSVSGLDTANLTPEKMVELVGDPNFAPGTDFSYSNTGYLLAGMIVEKATGSKLGRLLHERILDRLGLDHARFQPEDQPALPVAHGYVLRVDGWDGSGLVPNRTLGSAAWAAGGMTSTASDLAHWARALYGGQVLKAESLRDMLDVERFAGLPHSGSYGLGVTKDSTQDGTFVGHMGNIEYFQSVMSYLTDRKLALAVLANNTDTQLDALHQSLYRIVIRHLGA